jgi:hypothetical protein
MRFAERTIENRRKQETEQNVGRQCRPRPARTGMHLDHPLPGARGVRGSVVARLDDRGVRPRRHRREARPRGGLNLVSSDPERQARYLFREGGNIQALAARAMGAPTRVIGLTWIDERQAIMVRPDTRIMEPADLKGLRFALPGFARTRGESIARGMALHGIKSALALGGLDLDDVRTGRLARPPVEQPSATGMRRLWLGLEWLAAGRVDAVYVKGRRRRRERPRDSV